MQLTPSIWSHAVHHVVAALLERLPHILHRLLGTGQGGRRGFWGDGTGELMQWLR